jgi:hypothetical protein
MTVILRMWDVQDSNPGPKTGYPEVFLDFPEDHLGKYRNVISNQAANASLRTNFNSLFSHHYNI